MEIITIQNIFTFPVLKLENEMKYLGFNINCCRYLIKDWDWLIVKVENRIRNRSFHWLSKGGKLILVKAILDAIPVFWMHFWIPVGILEKIRKLCFKFLWAGNKDSVGLLWTSWKSLACPKFLGGWGLKIPSFFAKALAAKNVWKVINGKGLWVQIVVQKYIYPMSLLDWIRSTVK